MTKKRLIYIAVAILLIGGLWWKLFYTDKRQASGPVEFPLAWLSDDVLLTGESDKLFIRRSNQTRTEIFQLSGENEEFGFGNACIGSDIWWFSTSIVTRNGGSTSNTHTKGITLPVQSGADGIPKIGIQQDHDWLDRPMLPTCNVDTSRKETTAFLSGSESYQQERSITIDGQSVELQHVGGTAVYKFEGSLFLDREPAGLIRLRGSEVTRHPFPQPYAASLRIGGRPDWGEIIWDNSLGQALFIHNTCPSEDTDADCGRKALWLTPSLDPLSTVEIPGKSLIEIKSGYTCFSCGCGCYSHEDIYAENGIIYAHVWGYPVVNSVRGIYRLMQTNNGPKWEKIVSGRPQSPLAFSPRGDKVGFFEISRLGDEFRISEFLPK